MLAKLGAQLIKELLILLPGLAYKAFLKAKAYLDRRKKQKADLEAARRVNDASTANDVRGAADNLP